jgi:hypothetical protein
MREECVHARARCDSAAAGAVTCSDTCGAVQHVHPATSLHTPDNR